jgi:peptidoglycan/LPS O-acetylase OafA/YrhL
MLRLTTRNFNSVVFGFFVWATLPGISAALFESAANSSLYSNPIFRLPEFLLGACLFIKQKDLKKKLKADFGFIFSLVLLLIYLGYYGDLMPIYIGHNWIVLPLILSIIFSLSNEESYISQLFSNRLFVWLGKISYSFYSFQAIIILFLIEKYEVLAHAFPLLSRHCILACVSFVVLIFMSALGFYFVEEPFRKLIRRHGNNTIQFPPLSLDGLKRLIQNS